MAYNRDSEAIAKYVGADAVIYQTLPDLKGACADARKSGHAGGPREFESGVFSGEYITPVPKDYFRHLEKIRGEGRKVKAVEKAKEAVTHGVANEKDFRIATNGVKMDSNGRLVPASSSGIPQQENRLSSSSLNGTRQSAADLNGNPKVRDRMDISIHNLGDFPG